MPVQGTTCRPVSSATRFMKLDVAAAGTSRSGSTIVLMPEIDGGLRLSHGDVVVLARRDLVRRLLLGGAGLRPLVVDRLVGVAQVLVDQGGAELLRLDRPGHRLYLRHGERSLWHVLTPERRGWDSNPRGGLTRPLAFQASSLSHSDTSPGAEESKSGADGQ